MATLLISFFMLAILLAGGLCVEIKAKNRKARLGDGRGNVPRKGDEATCKCEEHLRRSERSAASWRILETIIPFPEFCCALAVSGHKRGFASGNLLDGEGPEDLVNLFMEAGMKGFSDERKFLGFLTEVTGKDNELLEMEGNCKFTNSATCTLASLLNLGLTEGTQACYCNYRTQIGCSYEDCKKQNELITVGLSEDEKLLLCTTNHEADVSCNGYCLLAENALSMGESLARVKLEASNEVKGRESNWTPAIK